VKAKYSRLPRIVTLLWCKERRKEERVCEDLDLKTDSSFLTGSF